MVLTGYDYFLLSKEVKFYMLLTIALKAHYYLFLESQVGHNMSLFTS